MTKRTVKPLNAERQCPECSAIFTATHGKQVFCTTAHQERFHAMMKARGKVAMPFMLVWRGGKRGGAKFTAYAMGQMASLADKWNAEDKKCGRRPELIVQAKCREGWLAVDLESGGAKPNCFMPAPVSTPKPPKGAKVTGAIEGEIVG